MDDELDIDNILDKPKKKKSVNAKRKGKRTELALCKLLKERFNFEFSRTIGSGNRWGQTFLPSHAHQTFSGDLVCPENFSWVIEAKGGYEDIDLHTVLLQGNSQVDDWIKQAQDESKRCERKPIVCWKRDRKDWTAFVRLKDIDLKKLKCNYLKLNDHQWIILPLDSILKLEDSFFFSSPT